MVELVDIEKKFEYPVLKKISYRFEEGKVYVIKGISGCGKSTLLNIIGGLDKQYSGIVKVSGRSLQEMDQKETTEFREKISYIFQNSLLISKITVMENLLFIKNDKERVLYYANKLGVEGLLDKYPEELSGGERQRIALIRAMLNEPKIILADEPSASLDAENSIMIADLVRELTDENCITIIATHEQCFDRIADEIIALDYGNIKLVKKQVLEKNNKIQKKTMDEKICVNYRNSFWYYVFKRNKGKYSIMKLLPSIVVFLILMGVLSIQNNIQSWYINTILTEYPVNMFSIVDRQYDELKNTYDLKIFDNYTYPLENIGVYPLLEKNDSCLAYAGIIEFGKFPEQENEIVVSQLYAKEILGITEGEEALGKNIVLGNMSLKIVGVLSDLSKGEQSSIFYSNSYYIDYNPVSLFVPYNLLKQIGIPVKSQTKMVKIQNLYDNKSIYEGLREYFGGPITEWDDKLVEMQYLIDSIFVVLLCSSIILALIAVFFIKNEVQLELYYRRKEIGYLQIFNLSKNRILHMILLERSARSFIALGVSILLFSIIGLGVQAITGYKVMVKNEILILAILVIAIYIMAITWIPCKKFLRKDIVELIV